MARRQHNVLSPMGTGYDMASATGDWRALASGRRAPAIDLSNMLPQQVPTPLPVPIPAAIARPASAGMTRGQMVLAALAVILLVYLAYRMGKSTAATPMQSVRKMSTNRLSKALYERLERNGRGSDRTRSALAQLGR